MISLTLYLDVNEPSKNIRQKTGKEYFLLVSRRSLKKRTGSGSGSISQRYGSAAPDPENCFPLRQTVHLPKLGIVLQAELTCPVPGTILNWSLKLRLSCSAV